MDNQIIIIKKTILGIEKPFLISELLYVLREKGIVNKELILRVLDLLLNEGLVDYNDIQDDTVKYCSLFATVSA